MPFHCVPQCRHAKVRLHGDRKPQLEGWWTTVRYGQQAIPISEKGEVATLVFEKLEEVAAFYVAVAEAIGRGRWTANLFQRPLRDTRLSYKIIPARAGTRGFCSRCPRGMSSEIVNLVSHADTLQEVVEGMVRMRGRDDTTIRRFLSALQDDDYRFLMKLDFGGKLIYLEWRYALSPGYVAACPDRGAGPGMRYDY